MLLYFISNKHRVLTKEAISEHLWGENSGYIDNFDFIYTHIKNLRKKKYEVVLSVGPNEEYLINEVDPEYPFAKSLASNIIEGALHQQFLREHLTTITNCNTEISPADFYIHLITTVLKK